jgi:hypothetical protein
MGMFDDLIPGPKMTAEPAVTIPREPVKSSARVWGDDEAVAAGLYDPPAGQRRAQPQQQAQAISFDDLIPKQPDAAAAQPQQQSMIAKAVEPITSYPATQSQMAHESYDQLSRGAGQVKNAIVGDYAPAELLKGVGNVALGGIGYVASPINAALRTVVGKPIEENTGIPKEIPETIASFAIPVPGASIRVGRSGIKAPAAVPSREQLYDAADAGYKAARDLGVKFDSGKVGDLAYSTQANLIEDGFISITAPKTHQMMEMLRNAISKAPEGITASFADMDGIRRALGKIAGGADKTDAAAAKIAMRNLDDFIAKGEGVIAGDAKELSRVISDARGNYAAASRAGTFERKAEAADLQAASGGSGANIDNAMRQRIKDILKSPKELRGFSPDEVVQMRKIVVGTPAGNTARLLGKLAPTGVVSSVMSGGAGYATLGPVGGLAVPAVGFAAKKLSDVMTARQMGKLDELIRSNSPLAKQMQAAVSDWSEKVNLLSEAPNTANVAKTVIATRNLVNNLKDADIALSASDFIKSLQGTIRGRAEDEQDQP